MKDLHFRIGDCVTYVDIFNATVVGTDGDNILIVMLGKGNITGQPIVKAVDKQWLEHGWKANNDTPHRRSNDCE